MKALVLDRPGSPESLYVTDLPQAPLGPGEVRVKVSAVGLNPVDYKLAATGFPTWNYPMVLGLDVAGIIEDVAPDVSDWFAGDPVYYHGDIARPGALSEYTVADARTLAWMPDRLSFVEAAALPCAGFTAYQAIHRKLRAQSGRTLLVHGGAGGVGGFAVQLGKLAGLRVFATCSGHNFNFVKALGADELIDYRHQNVPEAISELTEGRGVDYVIDTVGPESATASLELLAFNGEIVCVAGLPHLGEVEPFEKAISVHEVSLGQAYRVGDDRSLCELGRIATEFAALASRGLVRPMVEEVISLEEVPEALIRLSMRHQRGKIVVEINRGG